LEIVGETSLALTFSNTE